MITADEIRRAATQYDSYYLYEEKVILDRIGTLVREFPTAHFLYSMKANDNQAVTATILRHGFGADAASPAEVQRAEIYGVPPEEIHYSAPAKTERFIRETIGHCVLVADSVSEVSMISRIAQEKGKKAYIGLRLDPDYDMDGSSDVFPRKFGIEISQAKENLPAWLNDPNIEIVGIHVHLQSQILDWTRIDAYQDAVLKLADEWMEEYKVPLGFVNVGSGIGIAYTRYDEPVDLHSLGESLTQKWQAFTQRHPDVQLFIETGRYITGKCGLYVTKVIDRKVSRGKNYILTAGTMNAFLKPVIANMEKNNPNAHSCEPLFTDVDAHPLWCVSSDGRKITERETVTIVGNLCTANDVIAEDIEFSKLMPGDLLIVRNAGAYASVLSPMQFSSLPKPAQIMIREDDQRALQEVKERNLFRV